MGVGRVDRVALVTGGARGLGQAYCAALSGRGFRIAVADRDSSAATLERCVTEAREFRGDLTDPADTERLVGEVMAAFGRIDVLVNHLGGFPSIPFTQMTVADWERIRALNLDSCFYVCRAVVPRMVERRYGRIINIASGTCFKGNARMSAYIAAKMGVIGLTRVLASELGEFGITVNCVAPGLTDTPGAREYTNDLAHEPSNIAMRSIKRRETPEDVT